MSNQNFHSLEELLELDLQEDNLKKNSDLEYEEVIEEALNGYHSKGYYFPEMWNLLKYYVESDFDQFYDEKGREKNFSSVINSLSRQIEEIVYRRRGVYPPQRLFDKKSDSKED